MTHRYTSRITLTVTNADCDRAGVPVIGNVTLHLDSGQAVQLSGPNGSGKTTLLGVLSGNIPPSGGSIVWECDGQKRHTVPLHETVFYMAHTPGLKKSLTVAENLRFWASVHHARPSICKEEIRHALFRLEIMHLHDRRAARLSAGQQKRADIARALVSRRPVWILDEPAAFLDRQGERILAGIINEHLEAGGLAVIATHHELAVPAQKIGLVL